jgi:inosine/xanthosine triphosphate pyrophosphatase family protein
MSQSELLANFFVSESDIKLADLRAMMPQDILATMQTSIVELEEPQSSRNKIAVHKAVQAYKLLIEKNPQLNWVMVEDTTIVYSKDFVNMNNTTAYPAANTKFHIKAYKGKLDKVIELVDGYDPNQTKVWYTSAIAVAFNSNPEDVIYVENTVRGHFKPFLKSAKGLIDPQFVPEAVTESAESEITQPIDDVLGSETLKKERNIWHPRGGAFQKISQQLRERELV